jgi:hypothetical protein
VKFRDPLSPPGSYQTTRDGDLDYVHLLISLRQG